MDDFFKKQLQEFVQKEPRVLNFIEDEFFDWYGFVNKNTIENDWTSPSFLEKLGYNQNKEATKKVAWKDIVIPEDLKAVQKELKEDTKSSTLNFTLRYYKNNGAVVATKFKGVIVKDDKSGFTRILGVHKIIKNDNSYKKEKEQNKQLNIVNLALTQNNKELKQFSYLASHDLQQPINNIISYLSLLEENSSQLNDLGKLSVRMIKKNSYKMKHLITSLLEYSIIGANVAKNKISIDEVIESVIDILSSNIEEKKAVLNVNLKKNRVLGYRNDIHLLFLNLIENALKFSKPGRIPKITIDFEVKDNYFLYSVSDNGIGIDEVNFDKLFDIFYQIQSDEDIDGVGIGLAECKKIVELYGGEIWVESEENKGATFYFTLPKNN